MKLVRNQPLYLQIADYYSNQISKGELKSGDYLPSIREIGERFDVAQATAFRAVEYLKSAQLVYTHTTGTIVADRRVIPGPQQRLEVSLYPAAERVTVRAAEHIDAPGYIVPILGIEPVKELYPVIRREQLSYETDGTPFMLSVQWFPAQFAETVPELARMGRIESTARLIQDRTGRHITHGKVAREARRIKDDGREGPLLNLSPGTAILAEVYQWLDDTGVMEYGETAIIMDRVTEEEFSI